MTTNNNTEIKGKVFIPSYDKVLEFKVTSRILNESDGVKRVWIEENSRYHDRPRKRKIALQHLEEMCVMQ